MAGPRFRRKEQLRTSNQLFSGQLSPGLRKMVQESVPTILTGKPQWHPHQGNRQVQRNLKRLAKERKKVFGVEVNEKGETPGGIVVPGFEP